jgi:F-type H+-transporting ATPase subunit b
MIENARVAIDNEKNSAMVELKNQVATLSLEIAEKVVKERLSDQGEQEKLVSSLMKDVDLN